LPGESQLTDTVSHPLSIQVDLNDSEPPSISPNTSSSHSSSSASDSSSEGDSSESDSDNSGSDSKGNESVSSGDVSDSSDNESGDSETGDGSRQGDLVLYQGSNHKVDGAVYDILNDYLQHNETQASLASHLETFLKYLPSPNSMPKKVSHLFKYLETMDPTFTEQSHYYCSNCTLYIEDTSAPVCEACKKDLSLSVFYTFDVENQIRNLLENCGLADELDKFIEARSSRPQETEFIEDLTDGSEYRRLKVSGYTLTLMWYTDGVMIKHHSKRELWPIQFTIFELPPHLRSRYIGVCGV